MEPLANSIAATLAPYGFRPHWRRQMSSLGVRGFWRRCTWNTNRAAALVDASEASEPLNEYCHRLKWQLLHCTRNIPFLYELGLQLIVVDHFDTERLMDPEQLASAVDKLNNQFVVLQSVFVVDRAAGRFIGRTTWGQYVTGEFQTAIASALYQAGLNSTPSSPKP